MKGDCKMEQQEFDKQQALRKYAQDKIDMLRHDFHIKLTYDEREHFRMLVDEYSIDRYARDIIMKKL